MEQIIHQIHIHDEMSIGEYLPRDKAGEIERDDVGLLLADGMLGDTLRSPYPLLRVEPRDPPLALANLLKCNVHMIIICERIDVGGSSSCSSSSYTCQLRVVFPVCFLYSSLYQH